MSEPRRLVCDDDASPFARSLLFAGRSRREHEDSRERVWSALAAGLAIGTTPAPTSAAAKTGLAALGKSKLVVAIVLSVGIGSALVAMLGPNDPTPAGPTVNVAATGPMVPDTEPALASSPAVTPSTLPDATPKVLIRPLAAPSPRGASASRTPTPTPTSHRTTSSAENMREEAALLDDARTALTHGDGARASMKVEEARRRFPQSQLAQERDAIEVRAAKESGDHRRAVSLARSFVERYPDSPLRAGMEAIAHAPAKEIE